MNPDIIVRTEDRITHVVLDRPDKKNAITLAMYEAMRLAIEEAEADPIVRVMVITGTGDSFTSGNDVKDFLESSDSGLSQAPLRFLDAISQATKPILAAVNGSAIGIGTTLLLHCDMVYAAETARFQLPFVNLALVPEAGSSYILPRQLGYQRAAELIMLGEPFDARRARELGLVNAVVPDEQLMEHSVGVATTLAAKPPGAVRQTKALLKRGYRQHIADAMGAESTAFATRLRSGEAKEAMQAFLERRAPDFSRFAGD